MTVNDHASCEIIIHRWRMRASIAVIIVLLMFWALVGTHITTTIQRAIQNQSTATVAAEAIAVSDTVVILTDDRGTIVKSNADADEMFAKGRDIRGRNVHEWCNDKDAAERAADGMSKWYQNAPVGARRLLIVRAQLPIGDVDIMIMATALRREPGSNLAVMAIVNYWSQVSVTDLRPGAVQQQPEAEKNEGKK